jgi:hypothetical protein
MSNLNSFDDFDLDLYSIPNEKDGSAGTYSSLFGSNSSSSIMCATATNLTENDCNLCSGDALCTAKCK